MEWNKVIEGLIGSSPLAGGLGFACYYLAGQLKEARAEVARLNEARIADLQAIAKRPS